MNDNGLPSTFIPTKSFPEEGDLISALPKVGFCEIVKVTVHPMSPPRLDDNSKEYEIWLSRGDDSDVGKIIAPSNHLCWLGDHWVLFQSPYKISMDEGVGKDWCVTDPTTQKVTRLVAHSAEDAIRKAKTEKQGFDSDTCFVGEAYLASIKLDGMKMLRQIARDISKRQHPFSPLYGMDVSERSMLMLDSQLMFLQSWKVDKFVSAVEEAFLDLTDGNGFQWYMEGPTEQHCSVCTHKIMSCKCTNF